MTNEELKAEIENLKKTYRKQRNKRIDELQKENEQQKAQIANYQLAENESKEIIAELKKQNKDLCESLDIMNNRESELLVQIEKMKCCSNCKYCGACNRACNNWDKWEIYD